MPLRIRQKGERRNQAIIVGHAQQELVAGDAVRVPKLVYLLHEKYKMPALQCGLQPLHPVAPLADVLLAALRDRGNIYPVPPSLLRGIAGGVCRFHEIFGVRGAGHDLDHADADADLEVHAFPLESIVTNGLP